MKKGLSIQLKILALLVSLSVISTSLLALNSFRSSSKALENEIKRSLDESTKNIEGTIELFLQGYEQQITALAENRSIRNIMTEDPEQVEGALTAMQDFMKSTPNLQYIYVATTDKKFYIYPEADIPADFDPTSRPWYTDAARSGKIIWTDPYVDVITGKAIISVAKPLYDGSNQFAGVIGADVSLEYLTGIISSFKIGDKGYYILTDSHGTVLAHPDLKKIGKPLTTEVLMKAIESGVDSSALNYEYNGAAKHASYITIGKTGWKLFGTFEYSEIAAKTSVILRGAFFAAVVLILLSLLLGVLLSRPIIKNIKMLSNDMVHIGSGDFTVKIKVKSRDEIGSLSDNLNKMAESLGSSMSAIKTMAAEVSASSDTLAASSEESSATTEEIARTIQEIVKVTEDQAYSTEEGLKKTTHLAEKIQTVSEEIIRVAGLIRQSNDLNTEGLDSMVLLRDKSEASRIASEKVGTVVADVNRSAEQIGVIVEAISGIADQTNLLALNASIEAARAGESGRGFAVVANEIRKLAEQSAEASGNIRELIGNIQSQSKNAVSTMDDTKAVVEAQNTAVSRVEAIFNEISGTIRKLGQEVSVISELNETMLEKKNEILSVMESISASAQQTSASTEQISASTSEQLAATDEVAKTAEHLNTLAQSLLNEISKFKIRES